MNKKELVHKFFVIDRTRTTGKMRKINNLFILIIMFLGGCSVPESEFVIDPEFAPGTMRRVLFTLNSDGVIGNLKGYLFNDGILIKRYSDLTLDTNLSCSIDVLGSKDSRIYFIANTENVINNGNFTENSFTEDQFKAVTTKQSESLDGVRPFMTAMSDLSGITPNQVNLTMLRGIARVDLVINAPNTRVDQITIEQVGNASYLFSKGTVVNPPTMSRFDLKKLLGGGVNDSKTGVCYLHEQTGDELLVKINVSLDGVPNVLETKLPNTIKRNAIHTIRISGVGSTLTAQVGVSEWINENISDATPDLTERVRVDMSRSNLPADVTVSATLDTVFIPYWGSNFKLAIDASAQAKISVDGTGVTVGQSQPDTHSDSDYMGNIFDVTASLKAPNMRANYVYLKIRNNNLSDYYDDYIVLSIEANKTVFTGQMASYFNETTSSVIPKYIDGEIGQIEVLAGSEVVSDDNWLRIERIAGQNKYKISAGFKPNDPLADGRVQSGSIKVNHPIQQRTENYIVSRINDGLPVVLIEDVYWCQFNLKGNSRSFADQQKTVPVGDLLDHLKTCDPTQLLNYIGYGYKGSNTQGMPVIYSDNKYMYKDFASTGEGGNIVNNIATRHCPDGYVIPTQSDYKKIFSKSSNRITFGTETNNVATVNYTTHSSGARATISRIKRSAMSLYGGSFDTYFFKIQIADGDPLIIGGLGHQYENNVSLIPGSLLLGTADAGIGSWIMGLNTVDFGQHNNGKTRTLRCLKTPAFIY